MKEIQLRILDESRKLFNQKGLANVSIREISRSLGISHSNLIYHFKDKNQLVRGLHQQMLEKTIVLSGSNQSLDINLREVFKSTMAGFEIAYKYRFFLLELHSIILNDAVLHESILHAEMIRFRLLQEAISHSIENKIMRKPERDDEYHDLAAHVKIYSDNWISSAQIYDKLPQKQKILKYSRLFLMLFYPYLTAKGRRQFNSLMEEMGI